jgi:hypothetical protein
MPDNILLLTDNEVQEALQKDPVALMELLLERLNTAIGHSLNAETMGCLSSGQITLLAYECFRQEMMEGGMVQLIHNGYGPFIFDNPFAKVMKLWGLNDFAKLLYDAHRLYTKYRDQLTADCDEDEFMALYEQFPELDDIDDAYIDNETDVTGSIAAYVAAHLQEFNHM